MIIRKSTVYEDGRCNFCVRPHRVTYVLSGTQDKPYTQRLVVRVCNSCLHELKVATRRKP